MNIVDVWNAGSLNLHPGVIKPPDIYFFAGGTLLNTVIVNDNRVVEPSKIVCVGRNYREHIKELENEVPDEPIFFLKPNSAITEKLHSFHGEQLHYEAELSFLYQDGRFSAVGLGLDLTKRSLQSTLKKKGLPWERAKAFDGSALFSGFVLIPEVEDDLSLELFINDRLTQQGGIQSMIYKPDVLLKNISEFMSLCNGDVVMTGTPEGVGTIHPDDVFTGKVMKGSVCLTGKSWTAV